LAWPKEAARVQNRIRMSTPGNASTRLANSVTGVVLAGGRGRRMGGADKGLVAIAGRPMVERVLDALRPQVGPVLISANRHLERYAAFGHSVVPDIWPGYPGPLAGVLAALRRLETEFAVTVPCDAPLLPPDLVARLFEACLDSGADGAVVHDGARRQPAFMLLRATVAPSLEDFLADGGRRAGAWLERLAVADAPFGDQLRAFVNVNDADELRRVEALLIPATGAG